MEKKGVLIAFSIKTEKTNGSEKTKFFKQLYGWTQSVPKENKTYTYERKGMLDEMPYVKVNQSSFIVPEDNFDRVFEFFEEWSNNVMWKNFKILLDEETEREFDEWEEDEE